ncbi:MAG: hypothetical protein WKG01_17825 [Kofleriaceae bacterium]
MRALPAALIGSTLTHAVIGAVIAWREPAPEVVAVLAEPPDTPPVPVEFELVDLGSPVASAGASGLARAATRVETRGGRGGRSPPGESVAEPGNPAEPASTEGGMLKMRKPAVAGLSAEFMADFLARTRPLPGVPDLPGARIDAEISDLRDKLRDPGFTATASADELGGMRSRIVGLTEARKHVELEVQHDGTYRTEKETFIATVGKDGKVKLKDKPNIQLDGFGLKFDVTDAFMRAYGDDPYAAAKLRYLDRTRDQRVEIGKQHTHEQLAQSEQYAQANVARLWAMTTDLAARKQGLFELWDECEESGEAARMEGGAAARSYIIRFIGVKLVGRDAYTAEELVRLNKGRRSKARFVPY